MAAGARCGIVNVPEDYGAPRGRQIALNVLVLPATENARPPEAQFELDGGPGFAVTDLAGFYVELGQAYRRQRDIVSVDMRGTGASTPLRCPEIEAQEAADPWAPLYPPELVARCAETLGATADLTQYNTANATRDLEQVRVALGYEQVVLSAISYGTTLALAYIAEYPERVRSAVLIGTAPANAMPPRLHAQAATGALDSLLNACAADEDCHRAFPNPRADLTTAQGALGVERGEIFGEWLRTQMYTPSGARRVPLLLKRAARGDFSALTSPPTGPQRVFADGLYLTVTCAESLARFDVDVARAEARTTAFGDYRLRRQQRACAIWPVVASAPPEPSANTSTPILFISGEFDPATPPAWADEIAERFTRSRHVVLPGSGHIFDGMSGVETCLDPMLVAFLDSGDPASLNTACVADMRAPAFVTE